MSWRVALGEQIKSARANAGLSQQQLAQMTLVKREHISNIELGKNSPAVKIVTDIARALKTRFRVDQCIIDPNLESSENGRPFVLPQQMKLDFGVEYRFEAQALSVTAHSDTEIELHAILSGKKRA